MTYPLRLIIFIFVFIWFTGIFFEWIISFNNNLIFIFPFAERTYSLVCHQDSTKLIGFNNHHTFVCARCTGIYFGVLICSFLNLVKNFKISLNNNFIYIFFSILLLDVFATTIGIYEYSKIISFLTGVFFGSVAFSYFYYGLNKLFEEKIGLKN
ncbi:MAG: DUF2085 domain-containing protein [Melioribacteraceae bacterium]|nr:DUF2085 domain-containing protein [Melioribacteraceae bacterium]